jgi:hypothetical protein
MRLAPAQYTHTEIPEKYLLEIDRHAQIHLSGLRVLAYTFLLGMTRSARLPPRMTLCNTVYRHSEARFASF